MAAAESLVARRFLVRAGADEHNERCPWARDGWGVLHLSDHGDDDDCCNGNDFRRKRGDVRPQQVVKFKQNLLWREAVLRRSRRPSERAGDVPKTVSAAAAPGPELASSACRPRRRCPLRRGVARACSGDRTPFRRLRTPHCFWNRQIERLPGACRILSG